MMSNKRLTALDSIPLILGLCFGIIGTVFFIIGAVAGARAYSFEQTAKRTTATVCSQKINGEYIHPLLDFEIDGVEYKSIEMNIYSQSMQKNTTVDILFKNTDGVIEVRPQGVMNYIFAIIFALIGLAFLIASAICSFHLVIKLRRVSRLRDNGFCIKARVDEIRQCVHIAVNRRNPFVIICSYSGGGEEYTFKSDYLMEKPKLNEGDYVTVYVDSDNYRRYYIDIENL